MRVSLLLVALSALFALSSASLFHQQEVALLSDAQDQPSALDLATAHQEVEPFEFDPAVNGTDAQQLGVTYKKYLQCDAKWKNQRIGTSSKTICQVGCAMTSYAMALATYGARLQGAPVNPSTLDTFLTATGGYVSGNLLVWSGGNSLKSVKLYNYYRGKGSLSVTSLRNFAKQGRPVIVNVNNGGHWVLITGGGSGNSFPVHDPAGRKSTFLYSEMSNYVVYSAGKAGGIDLEDYIFQQ